MCLVVRGDARDGEAGGPGYEDVGDLRIVEAVDILRQRFRRSLLRAAFGFRRFFLVEIPSHRAVRDDALRRRCRWRGIRQCRRLRHRRQSLVFLLDDFFGQFNEVERVVAVTGEEFSEVDTVSDGIFLHRLPEGGDEVFLHGPPLPGGKVAIVDAGAHFDDVDVPGKGALLVRDDDLVDIGDTVEHRDVAVALLVVDFPAVSQEVPVYVLVVLDGERERREVHAQVVDQLGKVVGTADAHPFAVA